ncbi:MAG: RNA polymerase sigma factor, partial [Bacteroidota bacterium]
MRYDQHSTDESLRQGCLRGDRRAQAVLYRRYYGKLLGIPMRYTSNRKAANALLNQAFLEIFKSLSNYQEQHSFAGWLSTITFRVTMDHLRYENRYRDRIKLQLPDSRSTTNTVESDLAAEDIFAQIQALPDHLRVVFNLYVIEGYKHQEIAKVLGITTSNSKWRLSKAKELLRASLGPLYNRNGKSA